MNAETIKGQWKQVQGSVRKQWGKLTDDDMMQIKGDREMLIGKIQERYGMTREQVEREVDSFKI